jgi:uncharacterized repeat protein (TIGR04076 family)
MNDSFKLYDLNIIVEGDQKEFICSHEAGLAITVRGENIKLVQPNGFSFYALSSILPLIAAKQRQTDANDWMSTDDLIACPDPNCGARFKIVRNTQKAFRHSETSSNPTSS